MSFTNTWNYLQQIDAYPCALPDPVIWFVTAAPAVTPAIVDFISYGCRDIVKFKAGIGQPCGRMFKAAASKTFGPSFSDPVTKLLKFTAPAEKLLFWWFVADLASDTIARWTSLAYKLNGCPALDNMASWQYNWIPQGALSANRPKPIAGNVINYQGMPGLSGLTGAIVPPRWYWQASFSVKVHPVFIGAATGIKTWIASNFGHNYDYAAYVKPPGYPDQQAVQHFTMRGQNPSDHFGGTITMMAETTEIAIVDDVEGYFTVSELPITDWALSPLGCFQNMNQERQEDPAKRNRKGRQPGILDPFLPKPINPRSKGGPPGGLPRKK